MTRQTRNSEINTSADSLVGKDGEDPAVLQQTAERTTRQDLALAADNQTALVENRVIPNLQIQNDTKGTSARGDWASARVEARQESERNISAGNPIHTIRYGDTLWDVAAASFKTNNGHKASAAEIMGEVTRLTQKTQLQTQTIFLSELKLILHRMVKRLASATSMKPRTITILVGARVPKGRITTNSMVAQPTACKTIRNLEVVKHKTFLTTMIQPGSPLACGCLRSPPSRQIEIYL